MKKVFAILAMVLICATSTTFAEEPTCILLKFSNDTRYKNVDTASVLSDFVIEKLLASGKFNFKETKPIDEDIEARLYDLKTRELLNVTTGLRNKNLNALFEGSDFDKTQAQTIGTADVGQIITPSITSAIANQHGADYLIQGNVINIGSGNALYNGHFIDNNTSGIAIEIDLRVIKASTGEVVWRKIVTGEKKKKSKSGAIPFSIGGLPLSIPFKTGSSALDSDAYNKAIDDAAKKISEAMIKDLEAGRLFVK